MSREKPFLTTRELCLMALLTVILFLQEELLTFLPNIQLTVFLILLYAKLLGLAKTAMIVTVYLLLDAVFMGALNPLGLSFQWIGWMLNPLLTCTLCRHEEKSIPLAFAAAGYALLYSWMMIVPGCILMGVKPLAYLAADVLFEVLLAASSFLSTLLLYEPLSKLLRRLLKADQ